MFQTTLAASTAAMQTQALRRHRAELNRKETMRLNLEETHAHALGTVHTRRLSSKTDPPFVLARPSALELMLAMREGEKSCQVVGWLG